MEHHVADLLFPPLRKPSIIGPNCMFSLYLIIVLCWVIFVRCVIWGVSTFSVCMGDGVGVFFWCRCLSIVNEMKFMVGNLARLSVFASPPLVEMKNNRRALGFFDRHGHGRE